MTNENVSEWIKVESPFAQEEIERDGEVSYWAACRACGGYAGFDIDIEGFAGNPILSKYCPDCGKRMKNGGVILGWYQL